jgi:hypothetical protein
LGYLWNLSIQVMGIILELGRAHELLVGGLVIWQEFLFQK